MILDSRVATVMEEAFGPDWEESDSYRHLYCLVAGLFTKTLRQAEKDRDMAWWEALALVDNVAPTPEGVKDWLLREQDYHLNLAVSEALERAALLAESRAVVDENADDTMAGVNRGKPWRKLAAEIRVLAKRE